MKVHERKLFTAVTNKRTPDVCLCWSQ